MSESNPLKINIQETRSWHPVHHLRQNRRGVAENSTDYFRLKITGIGDCSHSPKTLLFEESAIKSRKTQSKDAHFADKGLSESCHGFPVVTYDDGTIKKAECLCICCFELVVWEKTLESPELWRDPTSSTKDKSWCSIVGPDAKANSTSLAPDEKNDRHKHPRC